MSHNITCTFGSLTSQYITCNPGNLAKNLSSVIPMIWPIIQSGYYSLQYMLLSAHNTTNCSVISASIVTDNEPNP